VSDKRKKPKTAAKRELRRLERLALEGRLINGVELPPGAIAADHSKQVPNNSYGLPRRFYVDLEFTCKDCGREEIWTARQQKWYYEVAKGSLYATAVRCRACRRKQATTEGRGDPNPIKHFGTLMKRIRRQIESPLRDAGFKFVGHDTRILRWPASIEYSRPGMILRCVCDHRQSLLFAETLDDRAVYRVVAEISLSGVRASGEFVERIDAFAAAVADFVRTLT
jgi:Probable zinc-ribbon domain